MAMDIRPLLMALALLAPFSVSHEFMTVESWHSFLLGAAVCNILKEAIILLDSYIGIRFKKTKKDISE